MAQRRAGILCHITSLPGNYTRGTLGVEAYKFIDFLSAGGFSVWQILPIGPTHKDLSPYNSLSAHAGNPQLIDLDWLCEKGWLSSEELTQSFTDDSDHKLHCLRLAYAGFQTSNDIDLKRRFQEFKDKHRYWLDKYALFTSLRIFFNDKPWTEWSPGYRDCEKEFVLKYFVSNEAKIESIKFQQFVFFTQWYELKQYAHDKKILIIGDIPIFVSHDSAEVWANRKFFNLNKDGIPEFVAGVPPDYFSQTGQRWGNPHYRWHEIEQDGFKWWIDRIRTQSELFDAIRIDHFRGLSEYWEIPYSEADAINGRWVAAPGEKLLIILTRVFPGLSFIAEDLGTITPDVLALRDKFSLPGMCILQFAFDGSNDNPYLPHNHKKNSLVYTATHDNDSTVAWFHSLPIDAQLYVRHRIGYESEEMPWPIIHAALNSEATVAIIPMQDILCLGEGNRMNTPGTTVGNWQWRFHWIQVDKDLSEKFLQLLRGANRTKANKVTPQISSQTMQPISNL